MVARGSDDGSKKTELSFGTCIEDDIVEYATKVAKLGIYIFDPQTQEAIISDSWKELMGIPDDFKGRPFDYWAEHLHPDDSERMLGVAQKLATGEIDSFIEDFKFHHSKKGIIWIRGGGKIRSYDEEGKPEATIGFHQDITEQKKTDLTLQESEAKFRSLVGNIPGVVYRCSNDKHWTMLYMSDRVETLSGYPASEFLDNRQRSYTSIIHPDDVSRVNDEVQKGASSDGFFIIEYRILRADGSIRWVFERGTVVKQDAPAAEYIDGFIMDITERKEAEDELRRYKEDIEQKVEERTIELKESKKVYSTLVESSNDGIVILQDDIVKFANKKMLDIATIPEKEVLGTSFLNFISEDDTEKVIESYMKRLAGDDSPNSYEITLTIPGGREIPVDMSSAKITHDGERAEMVVLRDITQRKKAEKELRNLSEVVKQSPMHIVITDPEGNIEYVNPAFNKATGYSLEEVIDGNPKLLQSGETSQGVYEDLWGTILSGRTWRGELKNKKKDGTIFWEHATISPSIDENGTITHFIAVKEDITEKKRNEKLIKRSLEEKTALLREVHDRVKNNLQIILGLIDMQITKAEGHKDVSLLLGFQGRVKSLALVHEGLYISEDLANISFLQYAQKLGNSLARLYGGKGQDHRIEVFGDEMILDVNKAIPCGLIMNELISNAFKHAFPHGRKGKVTIEIISKASGLQGMIISDNGVGIPSETEIKEKDTLGLQMVSLLTKQLDGTYTINREGGSNIAIMWGYPTP